MFSSSSTASSSSASLYFRLFLSSSSSFPATVEMLIYFPSLRVQARLDSSLCQSSLNFPSFHCPQHSHVFIHLQGSNFCFHHPIPFRRNPQWAWSALTSPRSLMCSISWWALCLIPSYSVRMLTTGLSPVPSYPLCLRQRLLLPVTRCTALHCTVHFWTLLHCFVVYSTLHCYAVL